MQKIYLLMISLFLIATSTEAQKEIRQKNNFDFDWKFTLNNPEGATAPTFNDKNWQDIQLPHDWSIHLEFDPTGSGSAGFLPGGLGWYRKTFTVPNSYQSKKVSILFDGIFHQSDVYINGQHLGFRPYGFCSIEYDLTPYLRFNEENVIAVRVDHTGERARWYTGSGIYRHAWLQVVNPVHIATYGTYITTPEVSGHEATVEIVTTVINSSDAPQNLTISQRILNAAGKAVAKSSDWKLTLQANNPTDVKQNLRLANPQLWDIESPNLYTMETTVKAGNKIVDVYTTPLRRTHFQLRQRQRFLSQWPARKTTGHVPV